jgi:hypothetical protein
MSVILITPDGYGTLRRTVQALRRQTVREKLELVLVGPSREPLREAEAELQGFAGHQLVEIGVLTSTAVARAAGVRAATAPVIALAEDHCFPEPGWAAALLARHREPWTGVGPAVGNANPATLTSWANLLIEYGDWVAPTPAGARHHIPGHNSSYKRDALLAYGEALSDVLEAESTMQWDLAARGHRFCLEPTAQVQHLNYSRWGASVAQRFHGGRLFAANRARHWSVARRAFYALAAPLIPLVRTARTFRTACRIGQPRRKLCWLPVLLLLVAVDGLGELIGYAAGAGTAMRTLTDWEFHRERFLCSQDKHLAGPAGTPVGRRRPRERVRS